MAGIYNRTLVEPKAAMFVIDSTIGQSFGEEVRPEKVDMFSRMSSRQGCGSSPTSTVFRVGGFVFYCLRFFSSLRVLTCQALCRSNADCSLCANTSQSSAGAGSRLPSEQIVRCRGPLAVWTDSTRR